MKTITNLSEGMRGAINKIAEFIHKQPSKTALMADEDGNTLVVMSWEQYNDLQQRANKPVNNTWVYPTWWDRYIYPTPTYPRPYITWNDTNVKPLSYTVTDGTVSYSDLNSYTGQITLSSLDSPKASATLFVK